MRMSHCLLLVLVVFIASCVSHPPYVPPADGPTAQLTFSQDYAHVLFYPDGTCQHPQQLGTERTIKVAAGKRTFLSVAFSNQAASSHCKAYVSFEPATNQGYLVEYYEPDGSHCSVSVKKIGPDGSNAGQEPSRQALKC